MQYKDATPHTPIRIGTNTHHSLIMLSLLMLSSVASALAQQDAIPPDFNTSQWSWVSNEDPILAVIPGTFNRTVFDASSAANVFDQRVATM